MMTSCVCEYVVYGGGRWEADGGGIQNQKQEPHTKMWGTKKRKSHLQPLSSNARADRAGFGGKAATSETVAHVSQLFSATEPPFTRKNTMFRANPNTQIPSMM